jgi:HEXXH motif-containing protein
VVPEGKLTAHRLSAVELRAVAVGEIDAKVVSRLKAAKLSMHQLLLAALMRAAAGSAAPAHAATLVPAYRLLAAVQVRDERLVRDMLALPQVGSWAVHCLSRLNAFPEAADSGSPLGTDLGQLAVIACAAALRAGHPFGLDIPLRHGEVTFPTLGTARPGAGAAWEWGRACLDDQGGRVSSSVATVRIPRGEPTSPASGGGWSAIPQLSAAAAGLTIGLWLDDRDPYLDGFGLARVAVDRDDLLAWQGRLAESWGILARRHRRLAAMIAELIRAVVPLAEPFPAQPVSATAAAAFGAVGLSLPADALALAEVLVHECHHAVLSAVTDLVPLTGPGGERLTYAPWREDARPVGALLQGAYAQFGLTGFWRRQRRTGSAWARIRGNAEFARGLAAAAAAAAELGGSGVLTEAGQEFVGALQARLASWQGEPVPAAARELAAEGALDHRARWRLRHLRPDPRDMRSLARAWLAGDQPTMPPAAIGASLERQPPPPAEGSARSYLLQLRYSDPERFRRWARHGGSPSGDRRDHRQVDTADRALLCGNDAAAAEAYLRRIAAGEDGDAWAGLAVVRQRTGPAGVAAVLAERPEVAADLHERLRPHGGPDPDRLAAWLAGPGEPPGQEAVAS